MTIRDSEASKNIGVGECGHASCGAALVQPTSAADQPTHNHDIYSQVLSSRRTLSVALLAGASVCAALVFTPLASLRAVDAKQDGSNVVNAPNESARLDAFRQSVGGSITPLIVELKGDPVVLRKVAEEKAGRQVSLEQTMDLTRELLTQQNQFLAQLENRGVRALVRQTNVEQINGSKRQIHYRFTYLLNGFVAYVASDDVAKLRALPEVAHVSEPAQAQFHLDRAIDYSLGTQTNPRIAAPRCMAQTRSSGPLVRRVTLKLLSTPRSTASKARA
jgi:hypothetical protein